MTFKFNLNQAVCNTSTAIGTVIARAEYSDGRVGYLVSFSGEKKLGVWCDESELWSSATFVPVIPRQPDEEQKASPTATVDAIEQHLADSINRGGGPLQRAIEQRYGLSPSRRI
jgi:hypothetical protein